MITTAELHRCATRDGLRFDQAEKDYVILLLLSALSRRADTEQQWFFKGGTCLRYCYYPGYRFSEDIDFSCAGTDDHLAEAARRLTSVTGALTEATGVRLTAGEPRAEPTEPQVEISVSYSRGGLRRQSLPVVRVHLSFDEPLLAESEDRPVHFPYSEPGPFSIVVYSKLEIVAEKLRALLQQQERWPRPRDLYDLWYITCHKREVFDRERLRELFELKCGLRALSPDAEGLRSAKLYEWNRKAWSTQLSSVLRTVPDYDRVWGQWVARCKELL
jgi:predicted nucleotidyltransferase component of viral defense system